MFHRSVLVCLAVGFIAPIAGRKTKTLEADTSSQQDDYGSYYTSNKQRLAASSQYPRLFGNTDQETCTMRDVMTRVAVPSFGNILSMFGVNPLSDILNCGQTEYGHLVEEAMVTYAAMSTFMASVGCATPSTGSIGVDEMLQRVMRQARPLKGKDVMPMIAVDGHLLAPGRLYTDEEMEQVRAELAANLAAGECCNVRTIWERSSRRAPTFRSILTMFGGDLRSLPRSGTRGRATVEAEALTAYRAMLLFMHAVDPAFPLLSEVRRIDNDRHPYTKRDMKIATVFGFGRESVSVFEASDRESEASDRESEASDRESSEFSGPRI